MLTIFHTNDFHGRLSVGQAAHLKALRGAGPEDCLLVDAGDAVSAGNITFKPGGEPILDLMSDAGYDAMTIGNREFHFSLVGFRSKVSRAAFPILCANVRRANAVSVDNSLLPLNQPPSRQTPDRGEVRSELPVIPYILHQSASGWRVVIFGLTVPMITERMTTRRVSASVFDAPIDVAKRLVPELRNALRPDLVIALTHIGIQRDRELAAATPNIDLIVGGHTHVVLEQGERVGDTLIVQAGAYARYVGRVEVERASSGRRLELRARLEEL